MSEELVKIEKPKLPTKWDYNKSVKIGKQLFIRWKDITKEMANHFWIAREKLKFSKSEAGKSAHVKSRVLKKNWGDYCQEVSSIEDKDNARDAFNRMLGRFFEPRELPGPIKPQPIPEGKYKIIYADPPWKYGDRPPAPGGSGAVEYHYPSLSIEELCALPMEDLIADDAVLFLWVTSPILSECFEVIEAWGFEYKASFVWDKIVHNVGHYNSVRHEFLLICTRGSCLPENKIYHDSVVSIKRSRVHSEKPEKFRGIIDELYPTGPRIELFARKKVKNWDSWGSENLKEKSNA